MDKLQACMKVYKRVEGKEFHYTLKNKYSFKLFFKCGNLPHLLGLHKLIDLEMINKFNNKLISADELYNKIEETELTYEQIELSVYFDKIFDRIDKFHKINDLLTKDIVVSFKKENTRDGSTKLKADILLFLKEENKYIHLCLAKGNCGYYYPETFIVHENNYYIKGQTLIKVKKMKSFYRTSQKKEKHSIDHKQYIKEVAATVDTNTEN